ncbi:MAG: HIT family protein [Chitinophagaceae bacterium]|nr:HIT family protein [Chitinophagaceae bacterium]
MTVFTKIIKGEIPCHKIAENEKFIAFLDIEPLVTGHVLVVPKIEVDKIFDVPDDYLADMLVFAKPIAHAIEKAFTCKRCGISVIGLEVPHAHMHLIPINSPDDLNFTRPKRHPSMDDLKMVQQKVLAHIQVT